MRKTHLSNSKGLKNIENDVSHQILQRPTDIKIQADEILRLRSSLNKILAKNTKQTLKKIEKDTDRNFFMSSDEAKNYGIIDTILTVRS